MERPEPDPQITEALNLLSDVAAEYCNDGKPIDPRALRQAASLLNDAASRLEAGAP